MHTSRIASRILNSLKLTAAPQRSGNSICRAMSYTYRYPRPSLTVDAVIVSEPQQGSPAQLLLIKRKNPPCKGRWALPGGFVDEDEPLERAAARELQEETSVNPADVLLTQVGAFGTPGRDPRGWCITVAFAALVPTTQLGVKAADDAAEADWFPITALPQPLAFDHKEIVRAALLKLGEQHQAAEIEGLSRQIAEAVESLQGSWDPPTN